MAVRLLLSASARGRSLNLRFAVKGIHRAFVREQRLSHGEVWSINRSWITPAPRVRSSPLHTTALLSNTSAAVSSLERATDGKKCKIIWKDGEQSTYHAVWLRDNCHCPECWDSGFDMKIVLDTKELRGDVRLHSVKLEELPEKTMVHFCWSYGEQKKEHRGCIDLQWLKDNSYSAVRLRDLQKHCQPLPKAINSPPELKYSDIMKGEETLWKWLKALNEHGMCLVTDIPTNLGEITNLAKIAGGLQGNHYGMTYQSISEESPDNIGSTLDALSLHLDLQYYESPSGLQLLHCLRLDDCVEGGDNIWLDCFAVVEEMRKKFPQHFKTLTEVPATLYRFTTLMKPPVALKIRRPHIILGTHGEVSAMHWALHSHGPLQVPEGKSPPLTHITEPECFNTAIYSSKIHGQGSVKYCPVYRLPRSNNTSDSFTQEDVERYYEAYCCLGKMIEESDLKIQYHMKPGQAMTINNRRIFHGRNAFKLNGGVRHMELCYVGPDTFKSKTRLMAAKYEPDYCVKNVFNQDYGPY